MVDAATILRLLEDTRVQKGLWIALTWLITLVLTHWNGRFFDMVDRRLTTYAVPERRLAKLDFLVDIFLILLAALISLHILGVSQAMWGAVAITSIAGAVVALAGQRLGQNLLAGLVILFERPFIIGDTIEAGSTTGKVQQVTLHSTTLETPDGPKAILPNSDVVNGRIINVTRASGRRLVVPIDVVEAVDMDRVREVLERAVRKERHLQQHRPITIFA
ncbi:MAG: mechanosensitive ion channel, partial [Candidatus Thermoplasmatota archaeon]|nr:mechanosensitive ion channel [Candidatus Thermoplasmatota archaeon]